MIPVDRIELLPREGRQPVITSWWAPRRERGRAWPATAGSCSRARRRRGGLVADKEMARSAADRNRGPWRGMAAITVAVVLVIACAGAGIATPASGRGAAA